MPSHGEIARPVPFRTVPYPVEWVVGDTSIYLVITHENWFKYYLSSPTGSNFETYIYIVTSLGLKPNPGYSIGILQIEQLKDRITIKVELQEPDPKKVYPQVIVRPMTVAEVAKADMEPSGVLEFVFVDQKGRQLAALKQEI